MMRAAAVRAFITVLSLLLAPALVSSCSEAPLFLPFPPLLLLTLAACINKVSSLKGDGEEDYFAMRQ